MDKLAADIAKRKAALKEKQGSATTLAFVPRGTKATLSNSIPSEDIIPPRLPDIVVSSSISSSSTSSSSSSSSSSSASVPTFSSNSSSTESQIRIPSSQEITIKLRKYGQPVFLFGETEEDRKSRLDQYERDHLIDTEIAVNAISDKVKIEVDVDREGGERSSKRMRVEEIPSSAVREEKYVRSAALVYRGKDKHKFMYHFFKALLHEWEADVDTRKEELHKTALGRQEMLVCKQTREYLRPFFQTCRDKSIPDDVAESLYKMAECLSDLDYKGANDAYISIAVGNNAWLIGVSQVGIHERAAREKVYQGKITHVLNDEEKRRYITSIKRLGTYLQAKEEGLKRGDKSHPAAY